MKLDKLLSDGISELEKLGCCNIVILAHGGFYTFLMMDQMPNFSLDVDKYEKKARNVLEVVHPKVAAMLSVNREVIFMSNYPIIEIDLMERGKLMLLDLKTGKTLLLDLQPLRGECG